MEWFGSAMSEFKFACPVCGQHITADSRTSGSQLDCPTCFTKLLVPQAPTSADSKLIVSAAQVGKPRPAQSDALWQDAVPVKARRLSALGFIFSAVVVCALGVTIYVYRQQIATFVRRQTQPKVPAKKAPAPAPRVVYPIPTNINWTLELTNAPLPEAPVIGGLHGTGFVLERATLIGGNLHLRQGRAWPPDLGVTVALFASKGEELSRKSIDVGPDRPPPRPKVTLRWKDSHDQVRTREFTNGYALKILFGEAANSHITGRIYLGLPDEQKSFLAGTFNAEIRKPQAPKPVAPATATKPNG